MAAVAATDLACAWGKTDDDASPSFPASMSRTVSNANVEYVVNLGRGSASAQRQGESHGHANRIKKARAVATEGGT